MAIEDHPESKEDTHGDGSCPGCRGGVHTVGGSLPASELVAGLHRELLGARPNNNGGSRAPPLGPTGLALPRYPIRWDAVSYTHLRAHETGRNLVCRLLLEK